MVGRLRRCAVSLDCGCAEIADVLGWGCDGNMTIVILYRNKWIFGKIRVIMMLLSEMRVTIALEYRKIVNKNEFSERGWIYGSYQSGCGCSGWYVGGSVEGVFLL